MIRECIHYCHLWFFNQVCHWISLFGSLYSSVKLFEGRSDQEEYAPWRFEEDSRTNSYLAESGGFEIHWEFLTLKSTWNPVCWSCLYYLKVQRYWKEMWSYWGYHVHEGCCLMMTGLTLNYLTWLEWILGYYVSQAALEQEPGSIAQIVSSRDLPSLWKRRGLFDFCTKVEAFHQPSWPMQLRSSSYWFQSDSHCLSSYSTVCLD